MTEKSVFSFEEGLMYSLREMYGAHGYLPFKMSKFEEYDFYMKNRDFLLGKSIISFTDADGTLLALKPDVTLSIIKNAKDQAGVKEKVYYNENVYRSAAGSHKFKEIMQMGLECIGDIDAYDVYEAVFLAAKSLERISADFVLDLSHMGLLSALVETCSLAGSDKDEFLSYIAGKNLHEAENLLKKLGTPPDIIKKVGAVMTMRLPLSEAADKIRALGLGEAAETAAEDIEALCSLISGNLASGKIVFDASVTNDMNYYNGMVFRGFIAGISSAVLSGGRYDSLMKRMGKGAGAVGFAIYLDLLEKLEEDDRGYDVDVLLIYDKKLDTGAVISRVNELISEGLSVSAQHSVPERVRYERLERMGGGANENA